jgi:hypothetical protein
VIAETQRSGTSQAQSLNLTKSPAQSLDGHSVSRTLLGEQGRSRCFLCQAGRAGRGAGRAATGQFSRRDGKHARIIGRDRRTHRSSSRMRSKI